MKKRMRAVALSFILIMLPCAFPAALAAEEHSGGIPAGIEYASAAQSGDTLFFLGEYLYAYDAANDAMIQAAEEPAEALCPGAKAEDLMLVNGGSGLHALDTSNGNLYLFEEGKCRLVSSLENDIFQKNNNPYQERRFSAPTLAKTEEGETLYLLVSNEERPTEYDMVYFDLANGAAGLVRVDQAAFLTPYRDGKLAAVIERPDVYRIVGIDVAGHAVEDVLYEEQNPRYRITGIAYDRGTDRLVVGTGRGIFQISNQTMIDLCAYLPATNEQVLSSGCYCFLNGEFYYFNQGVRFTSGLDGENASKRLRFANSGIDNPMINGYVQENPDVRVSFTSDMVWNNEEIVNSLLTQDSDIDIIALYAGAGLTAIKNKKYYTDLSASEVLKADISLMIPPIREALMDGGALIAYPSDMSVDCWLVDDRALRQMGYQTENTTMKEWLDFVEEYARDFDADESAHALFPRGFTKKQLLDEILIQYILEYEATGQLSFTDPELKSLLERVLKLPKSIFLKEDDEEAPIDAYDRGLPPLFVPNTSLSPHAYVGFYEDYEPIYVTPPVFSTRNTPKTKSCLMVYLVNPYSKNQETAIEFLEYCARHAEPLLRFYVEQGYSQPIPDQGFADLKARTLAEMEALTGRLDNAAAKERAQINAEIDKQRIVLEYAERKEWLLSPADISAYQSIVPAITFLSDSLCFTDSTCSVNHINLTEMIEMMLSKHSGVGKILETAEHRYEMIQMEAN